MNRLLRGTLASVMALAFLFASPAVYAHTSTMHSTMHSSKMKHSCPKGEQWVKGYMRNGKKVHGYCRS